MEWQYFLNLLAPEVFIYLTIGVISGIAIGALPGLTATMGVALLLPVTFGLDATPALLLLIGIYFGAIYGGSITGILINTPGTPSAAATVLDGYPLTKKGQGMKALKVATLSSALGGIISVIILIFLAPKLAKVALQFGAPEYFALAVFGLSIVSILLGNSAIKGLIATVAGLLIGSIGMDPVEAFPRFTFDNIHLLNGLNFIVILIGLFAASQAFSMMENLSSQQVVKSIQNTKLKLSEVKRLTKTILLSSGIGTFFGMLPGAGGGTAAFVSYNEAKRFSKRRDEFGKGNIEGVAAPETANNASTGGAMIPMLTLGLPGDAVTAILLGALMIQGLQPGPLLFENNRDLVHTLFLGMLLANVLMLIIGWFGIRFFTKVLHVPKTILVPVILVLCVVGSYALENSFFDVWVMFISGIIGYFILKYDFPLPPIILALILGPMVEENFRRSLVISQGSYDIFYTKPITLILLLLAVFTFVSPLIGMLRKNRKKMA